MNCKFVCREIDELDVGQSPRLVVEEHLRSCDGCRKFRDQRLQLREMIANVDEVAAPADFDFRLRARLASERSRQSSGLFTRRPAFSLPSVVLAAVALILALGFVMQNQRDRVAPSDVAVGKQTFKASEQVGQSTPSSKEVAATDDKATKLASVQPANTAQSTVDVPFKEPVKYNAPVRRNSSATRIVYSRRKNPIAELETAAVFPVEASEPLKVSLDYASGASRTISLPTLSFGSQEAVTRGVSQMSKASLKGVW
ncbi:MAG: hypothetical protein ABI967_04145 [bacterium]